MEKYWKICRFSGQIRPDWGNTARADMAGLGFIGLIHPLIAQIVVYLMMYDKN